MQGISILPLTFLLTGTVIGQRLLGFNGAHATAAGNAAGVVRTGGDADDHVAVDVLGTTPCTGGGVIAQFAEVEVGADGKAVTKTSGVTVGRAMTACAADGNEFELLLIQN